MKEAGGRLLAGVRLERDGDVPLYRQLYRQIRALILDGTLGPGTRLPSTRTLISEFGVSRATVVAAFEQLGGEGFLDARQGDGTYISDSWGEPVQRPHRAARPLLSPRGAATSARGTELYAGAPVSWSPEEAESFIPSQIAADAFPANIWRRLLAHHAGRTGEDVLGYCDPHGHAPLRIAVAEYLNDARGLDCEAEQVVITSGAQQAFTVLATLLLEPGDTVAVEDPGHIAGRLAFQAQGCVVQGVPVDTEGALTPDAGSAARLAYLTPSRQHPLGTIMSLARRSDWVSWASARNGWIVEDDGDGELRYRGRPLPTLFGLDPNRQVVHVGSFSKVLAPSLRLGYVVLPDDLVEPYTAASSVMARQPATVMQAALADFLRAGHMHTHLRRTRRLYAARQETLLAELDAQLGDRMTAGPVDAGLHVLGWLRDDVDDQAVARGLAERGVYTYPLGDYRLERRMPPALLIGFAGTAEDHLPQAVARMAAALNDLSTAQWTGRTGG